MSNIIRFTPMTAAGGTLEESESNRVATLRVVVEYLHHLKPHRTDSAERIAEKEQISFEARKHERTTQVEYPKAPERWTHHDVLAALDLVRRDMPTEIPANNLLIVSSRFDPHDSYRDGRALMHVNFWRKCRDGKSQQTIWFSTAAGYGCDIYLDGDVAASAIIPFVFSQELYFDVQATMNVRSLRRALRAKRGGAR